MKTSLKSLTMFALIAAAAIGSADITYDNIVATITFDGTDTYNLQFNANGGSIDFSALDIPMLVASHNSDYSSAVVTISYDVLADDGVSGLELLFTGMTLGSGTVDYEEIVLDGDGNELASVSGQVSGSGSYVQSDLLNFGGEFTEYSVTKTFTLDFTAGPGKSLAAIGIIEQNAVPEPATMGALAIGALGLLSRRKRR